MVVNRSELTWFARALPGRWRVVAPSAWGPDAEYRQPSFGEVDLRYSDAVHTTASKYPVPGKTENSRVEYVCDQCRHLIVQDQGLFFHSEWDNGYEWSQPLNPRDSSLSEAVGDHRHDEGSFVDGWIRFYDIMPTGPWKVERWASSWTEVFDRFISRRGVKAIPATPKWVFDDYLRESLHDNGMSGGIEYPGHVLTDAEYRDIREVEIRDFGRLDLEVPRFRDPLDFLFYTSGFAAGREHGR